jgi:large subunit ribosomal protein LX
MNYTLSGNVRIGQRTEKFTKTVEAKDEPSAKELVYTLFGSEHGVKRRWVNIEKVEKAKNDG